MSLRRHAHSRSRSRDRDYSSRRHDSSSRRDHEDRRDLYDCRRSPSRHGDRLSSGIDHDVGAAVLDALAPFVSTLQQVLVTQGQSR